MAERLFAGLVSESRERFLRVGTAGFWVVLALYDLSHLWVGHHLASFTLLSTWKVLGEVALTIGLGIFDWVTGPSAFHYALRKADRAFFAALKKAREAEPAEPTAGGSLRGTALRSAQTMVSASLRALREKP